MKSRKAFALRIDPDLFAELEGWAQQEFRSVNGQLSSSSARRFVAVVANATPRPPRRGRSRHAKMSRVKGGADGSAAAVQGPGAADRDP